MHESKIITKSRQCFSGWVGLFQLERTVFLPTRAALMEVAEKQEVVPLEDQPGSDLSEGEIADSLDSKSDGSVDEEGGIGTVEPAPPATKKRKKQSGGEDAMDASIAMNFGSFKSSMSKRQLKKQRKMEKERKRANSRGGGRNSRTAMKQAELTDHQATVLQRLKQFRMGVMHSGFTLPKLKTAVFREVVFSLIQSQKSSQDDTTSDACATENSHVVVVWLSMVSEKYYHQSPDHFPLLKNRKPVLQFKLEHPGSNRFAKLGLEAFMLKSQGQGDGNNSGSRNSGTAVQISPSSRSPDSTSLSPPPPRTTYLLSKQELEENGFPVMESPIDQRGVDCSRYVELIPWPSTDIEESLGCDDGGEESEIELPIFSIDCEMVETANGSELARISVVNEALECIYDTFVKPATTITDYRTKFSGITEDTLKDVSTTLQDVQEKLKSILPPKCIIAGHSLENDFHAMKLIHPYVIDTSCIFTPLASPLCKPKLKKLTMDLLSKEIQSGYDGHDSIEDATACMRLVQLKLKKGPDLMISFSQPALSLLSELQLTKVTTGIVDKAGVVRLFGRSSTHSHESDNDAETIDQAVEVVPKCNLTFVQLHSMENFIKSSDKNDSEKQLKVANELDSYVQKLIEGCPSGTLVLVVCGSSDISKVKQFQQQDFPDLRRWKEATMTARTGHVIAIMAN